MRPLARLLPYFSYLSWLAQFGFRHNHHVIFDHLAAPTAFYISREEFQSWFQQAALSEPRLSWRNQNSWRGWAVLDHWTMRILAVNYEFPPLGGGAGNATAHICRSWCRSVAR